MIEKNKEYYNQKISELYAVIENQEKIIRNLQENYNNELDENLKMSELWLKSKERIDKAIEFIENDKYEYTPMGIANKPINKVLLDILKGGNNE